MAWLKNQTDKKRSRLCHQTLDTFFKEEYSCRLPAEVELLFTVCPLKRQTLEDNITLQLQREADRRAEEARLEAYRRALEVRLEAERRAEEARLEAYRRALEVRLEAERRAEEARLEAYRRALEVRLEAERRAEEARLEAERRAEEEAPYFYALKKIENPTDDWEWWVSDECLALEKKYQEEYFLIKQGIIQVPTLVVPAKEQPIKVSEKAMRRAANRAAAAQREVERKEREAVQIAELALQKKEKMKHYVRSGW
jgi:hypothetical protein